MPTTASNTPPAHRDSLAEKAKDRALGQNPFSSRNGRENFPDLNIALGSTGQSTSRSYGDLSFMSDGSNALNLSIGARAALTDHMRHVAKNGIDGDESSSSKAETMSTGERSPMHSLDEQWNRILDGDGNFSPMTMADSVFSVGLQRTNDEVMDDQSTAYFDTSHVMALETPEHNRGRKIEMVLTRGAEYDDEETTIDDDDEDDDDEHSTRSSSILTPKVRKNKEPKSTLRRNGSYLSFTGTDISNISGGSVLKNSPMRCSASKFSTGQQTPGFSPILDVVTPSRIYETSLALSESSPFRQELGSPEPFHLYESMPPEKSFASTPKKLPTRHHRAGRWHSTHNNNKTDGQKVPTPTLGYSPSVSPLDQRRSASPVRPFTFPSARKMARPSSRQSPAMSTFVEVSTMDSMAEDFMRAMDITRETPPSPIVTDNLSVVEEVSNVEQAKEAGSLEDGVLMRNSKRFKTSPSSSTASQTSQHSTYSAKSTTTLRKLRHVNELTNGKTVASTKSKLQGVVKSFSAIPCEKTSVDESAAKSLIASFEAVYQPTTF